MYQVSETDQFTSWLLGLRDLQARARILTRINRVRLGNLGDAKFFDGIGELRIDVGPGYRVYFVKRGEEIILLLCGGDKATQRKDIEQAKRLAQV